MAHQNDPFDPVLTHPLDRTVDLGIILMQIAAIIRSLAGLQRAAVLAQIERIEAPSARDEPSRHVRLEKIVDISVQIQYGPRRSAPGRKADQSRRHAAFVIIG